MTKTQAKAIAKKQMLRAIGIAYYSIVDSDNYTEEEVDLILKEMTRYGERMAKAIGGDYIAY